MKLLAIFVFVVLLFHAHANPSNPSHGSCTFPSPGLAVPSPPPIFVHLLPSTFFKHFQESFLHIPAKDRSPKWRELVSEITPSLDEILSMNISTDDGPLRLGVDITLCKVVSTEAGRKRQTVDKVSGSTSVPASVVSALEDGFSVTVNRMTHRMASVNTLASGLSKEFGVRVTAEFTMHPTGSNEDITAQDTLHIILSDGTTAQIRESVLRYPFEEHIEALDESELEDDDGDNETEEVVLRKGDMLYIPRGDACTLPNASVLTLRLYTDEMTNVDVLQAFIDVASVDEGPLGEPLPGSPELYMYTDLAKELIDIAGAVTDELRRHFVVGEIDEEGEEDSMEMVSIITGRFLSAAHALLEPGLGVLKERDGLGQWAASADLPSVERGFRECVDWMMRKDLVEETVAEVFVKWFERREAEDVQETQHKWRVLKTYGESTDWVEFEWD